MPKELLFKQGDGSRELVWLISGQLHVSTNDEVKMTLRSDMGTTIVGEFGFFLGIQRTHSVSASSTSDVTLLVLSGPDYDEIVASYPEQGDLIVNNLLRKFGIDRQGNNTADATAGTANLDERELAEFELLRGLIDHGHAAVAAGDRDGGRQCARQDVLPSRRHAVLRANHAWPSGL